MNTVNDFDLTMYLAEFPEHAQVVPAFAYADAVVDYFHGNKSGRGANLPWSKVHGKFQLRPGEITIWAGYNGSGKSLLVGQIMLEMMRIGEPVCIASMEMPPVVTDARMCRQASGGNLPSDSFIRQFHDWTDSRLWFYAQQNTVKHDRMLALARYCGTGVLSEGKKVKIRHLVIDSLMKCGIRVDDYNLQKEFIDQLCSIAKDTGIHIHLVAHMRKAESEYQQGDKMDVKGASEITDQADNVFVFWRNKSKEAEAKKSAPKHDTMQMPDAILTCTKQRHGEDEPKIGLYFHKASMQFVGGEGLRPIEFMKARSDEAA